ncbi:MAG TPA: amidohydrolase family protein [Candidatus Saccharimonadales bacterium]|jgi:imidazolonepropionase-like amidohydrolase|nr:amidohydrolase family protein [Candidatus Saccharimonadales bacterium]
MRVRWICLLALISASCCFAQTTLSKEALEFVRVQSPVIALEHVRVIDGTGAAARADQTILIAGGRIAAIGASGAVAVPEGANRMDFTGFSAIPGLVGMHDHLFYPGRGGLYHNMAISFPRLYLASGVTSIRTGGNMDGYFDLEIKRSIDSGRAVGPKINATAPYLEGKGTPVFQAHQLNGPEDARRMVNHWAEEGAGSFKAYNYLTRAELKAAIDEAHRHHLKVTAHLCSIGFREAAELGIDNLEHGLTVDTEFFPEKKPDVCPNANQAAVAAAKLDVNGEAIQLTIRELVARHVAITSTLPVFEQFVSSRPDVPKKVLDLLTEDARKAYLANRARIAERKDSVWPSMFQREMEFERAFAKAGGILIAGLDPTGIGGIIAGFGDQREVELLVDAGFSPLEAIKIQTLNGAQFLGEQDHVGSLAMGKQADIVLVKGDPSANIQDIENVELVFKDGIGYDPKKLIDSVKGNVGNW